MTWQPLPGRVIVTRITQVTSDVLVIPDSYKDERNQRTADRGVVLAAGGELRRYECGPCMGTGKTDADAERDDCYICEGRGKVLCKVHDDIHAGDEVLYLGPAEKLAIVWNDTVAYAVTYDEVLGVVEP